MFRKVLSCMVLLISAALGSNEPPLGSWNIDASQITVSGLSAGAAFATQFHVGYSDVISGMGSWAGLANTCFATYSYNCMYVADYENVQRLIDNTDEMASDGRIDGTSSMAGDRVYIMHGTEDSVVDPDAALIMYQYYENYLSDPSSQMVLKNDLPSDHCVQSAITGTSCGQINRDIYIENCDFDSPFNILNFIVEGGVTPGITPGTYAGELLTYDQDEFFPNNNAAASSMDDTGYVYIPPKCYDEANQCLLHIFFHGCKMYADAIDTDFILSSGFLELADANNMVVMFPQTVPDILAGNPNGCYDWFKYTDPAPFNDPLYYATQEAPQMDGVYQMVKRAARLT